MTIFKRKNQTATTSTGGNSTSTTPSVAYSTHPLYKKKVKIKCDRCGKIVSEYWEYLYGKQYECISTASTQSIVNNAVISKVDVVCETCRKIEKLTE